MVVTEALREEVRERFLARQRAGGLEARIQAGGDMSRLALRSALRKWPWPSGFHVPSFPEFITSPAYLGDPPLTPRQYWALEQSIGLSAVDWYVRPRSTNVSWLCWGKGSGKDLVTSWKMAYSAFVVINMENPWKHFRQANGDFFDFINMAQDARAAKSNFYDRFVRHVSKPCFDGLLDRGARGDIQANITQFWKQLPGYGYRVPCVRVHSLNSKNESAEGKNTLGWVLDEADALRDAEGHDAATAAFNTLRTSNRFGAFQWGDVISWPRSLNGFILWGLRQCENLGGNTPEWWGDRAPTRLVIPWRDRKQVYYLGEWHAPDPVMAQVYRDDPDLYDAVYETNPPAVEGAFISQPEKIDEAVSAGRRAMNEPMAIVEHSVTEHRTSDGQTHRYVALLLSDWKIRPGAIYFVGGDAGVEQDSFALCISHIVPSEEGGMCCPACWLIRSRRYAKHYKPKKIPRSSDPKKMPVYKEKEWTPELWRCDWCSRLPNASEDQFWGLAEETGQIVRAPKVLRLEDDGTPVFAKDILGNEIIEEQRRALVVEDLLLEWKPDKRNRLAVDFGNVRDVLKQLVDTVQAGNASIGGMRFDRWQAESIIQEVRSWGIPCEAKDMSNPDQLGMYRNGKTLLNNNLLWLQPAKEGYPQHERARNQLREVQLINNRKIDHPLTSAYGGRGAKDLCDAEMISWQLSSTYYASVGEISYLGTDKLDHGMYTAGREMTGKDRENQSRPEYSVVGETLQRIQRRGAGGIIL
jgi:hypothetical protein